MRLRFGLIVAGLAVGLLALAGATWPGRPAPAAADRLKPQLPTLTPTLTPPPLSGCWTLGPSIGEGRWNSLNSVSATGPKDVWAVGVTNGLGPLPLVVHWDGQQWSGRGVPWGGEGVMNAVAALARDDVWAVGSPGRSDHWDGTAWTAVPVPGNRTPQAVAGAARNDVWALAEDVVIHWNGSAWAVIPLPPASAPALYGVAARPGDAWIVGDTYNDTAGVWKTLTEHWDGANWTVMPSPNVGSGGNHLQSVTMVGANDVWAVGSYDDHGVGRTLIEHWNGSAWTVVPSPNRSATGSWLGAVSASGPNDVWAAGTAAGPAVTETLIEHWDGQVWSVVPSPNNDWQDNTLHGIAVAAPGEVWAVGSYRTNGRDFYEAGLTLHYQAPCVVPPPPPCGEAFERQPAPAADSLTAIAAIAPNDIWTVGQRLLHWNGVAWSVIAGPDMGNGGAWRGVAAVATDDVWAVGSYNDGTHTQMLIGHWNGTFWDAVPSPNGGMGNNYLNGVFARAANDVWAVGYAQYDVSGTPDEPLILHWDGSAWSQVPLPGVPRPAYLNAVTAVAAADAWAVGAAGPGEYAPSLTLHWDGQSWQKVPSPDIRVLGSVAARAANDVWAASNSFPGRGLIHWDGSQWTAPGGHDSIFGLALGSGGQIWLVGRNGPGGSQSTAFAQTWDGSQWRDVAVHGVGWSGTQLNALAVLGPTNIWAVGQAPGHAFITHYTPPCGTSVVGRDRP